MDEAVREARRYVEPSQDFEDAVGLLRDHRVLICDRDRKWSREVRRELDDAGVHVALTPFQAQFGLKFAF